MATTITQAHPLLTAAELQLFDQSRAEPIKALTLARLRGKVTRARTLRDKYRDLYRRQTVAVRSARSAKGRSPVGADNERTKRKAEILQEVLGRFEARVALLEEREAREGASGAGKGKRAAGSARVKAANAAKPAAKSSARSAAKSPAGAGAKAAESPTASRKTTANGAAPDAKRDAERDSKRSARAAGAGAKARSDKAAETRANGEQTAADKPKSAKRQADGKAAPRTGGKGADTSSADVSTAVPSRVAKARSLPSRKAAVAAAAATSVSEDTGAGAPALPVNGAGASTEMPAVVQKGAAGARTRRAAAKHDKAEAPRLHVPLDLMPATLQARPLSQAVGHLAIQPRQSGGGRQASSKSVGR